MAVMAADEHDHHHHRHHHGGDRRDDDDDDDDYHPAAAADDGAGTDTAGESQRTGTPVQTALSFSFSSCSSQAMNRYAAARFQRVKPWRLKRSSHAFFTVCCMHRAIWTHMRVDYKFTNLENLSLSVCGKSHVADPADSQSRACARGARKSNFIQSPAGLTLVPRSWDISVDSQAPKTASLR
jgi:hypothetical protein